MAYTTLAALKSYLGIATDTTKDDVILQVFINQSTDYINRYTHRTFEEADEDQVRYYTVDDLETGNTLATTSELDIWSISEMLDVSEDEISSDNYAFFPRNKPYRKIVLDSGYSFGFENDKNGAVKVTGQFCYSASPPDVVVAAVTILAAWLYKQKDNQSDTDRPIVSPEGLVLLPTQVPSTVNAMLDTVKMKWQ